MGVQTAEIEFCTSSLKSNGSNSNVITQGFSSSTRVLSWPKAVEPKVKPRHGPQLPGLLRAALVSMTFGVQGRGVQGRLSHVSGATGSVSGRRNSSPTCCFGHRDVSDQEYALTHCCSCRQSGNHHHFICISRSSMKAPSCCPLFPASPGGFPQAGIGIGALGAAVLRLPFAGTLPTGADAASSPICAAAGARKGSRSAASWPESPGVQAS